MGGRISACHLRTTAGRQIMAAEAFIRAFALVPAHVVHGRGAGAYLCAAQVALAPDIQLHYQHRLRDNNPLLQAMAKGLIAK